MADHEHTDCGPGALSVESKNLTWEGVARPNPWQFLNALGDGIYGVDREGRCTFVNNAALALLGYEKPDELLGHNMHQLIHHTRPDGSPFPLEACPLLSSLYTGRAVRLDNELLWRRDGTSFFAEYSSFPLHADGASGGSVITFADLSIRQDSRRRHALQHAVSQVLESTEDTEAVQARLIATVGTGFSWEAGALWLLDQTPNLALASIWHLPEAVRRLPEASVLRKLTRGQDVPGQSWEKGAAVTAASLAFSGMGEGEIAFPVTAGGRTLGVFQFLSRHIIELDAVLSDELTTLGRQVGQFLVRRRAEAALRDSEALKTAIMHTALDCVVVVDADTHIREFNPAAEATFGWDRHTALGTELGALVLPADFLVGHLRKFAAYLANGETSAVNKRVEAEAIRAGGERFPVEISVTPLKVGEGALFATYMRDITNRKRSEREIADVRDAAEAANRAKSQFIAGMSHELRTPLSAIIGYSEMLKEEMADGDAATDFVGDMGKIESNARHLLGLINDVLDLSKVESGRMEVFGEEFDVAGLVEDVAATITTLVDKKGNTLDLQLEEGLGTARSDMVKIKQMLLNLLSNATKFTENGTIGLSAARIPAAGARDRLVFQVSDTGIGMTPEQLGRVFEAYVQADSSTARNFGGTGLGLSLSRHFAGMLGGTIEVSSIYGEGSRFTLTLPAEIPAVSASL